MDDTNGKTGVRDQVVPPSPIGLAQKEQAPPPISPKVTSEVSAIIEPSEKEPPISTEVREAGIEEVSERLPLTDEHKAIGIEHAGESTPVDTQPKLPMSENEALKIIKTTKNSDSKHWLAVLIEKIYKAVKSLK